MCCLNPFAFVSAPIDTPTLSPSPILPLARSLEMNRIGAEGATALAAILNETKISNLKCAAAPAVFAFVSAPAHTFANTPPLPCTLLLRQKRAHLLPWSRNLPPSSCTAFRILSRCYFQSCAVWTAATSSCRTGGSVLPYIHLTPLRPPRRSLQYNDLDDQAKQAVKDAAGSGASIAL